MLRADLLERSSSGSGFKDVEAVSFRYALVRPPTINSAAAAKEIGLDDS